MRLLQLTKPLVATFFVAGLCATLSSGCAENRSSVYIEGVLFPDKECVFQAAIDATRTSVGAMCAGTSTYFGHILVANQLTKLADATTLKTETNIFQIEGIEVNVLNGDGSSAAPSFSAPVSGSIPAANGGTPGLAAIGVQMLSDAKIKVGGTLISEFRIFGSSLGGLSLQTGWFRYPIQGVECSCPITKDYEFCDSTFISCIDPP